jgi:hypothetical protein
MNPSIKKIRMINLINLTNARPVNKELRDDSSRKSMARPLLDQAGESVARVRAAIGAIIRRSRKRRPS